MTEWTIREAADADVPALVAIVRAAFEEYRGSLDPPSGAHAETEQSVRRKLETAGAAVVLVGSAIVGCVFYQEEPGRLYLSRLSVLPPYRRRGIGQKLVDFVEAQARARGLSRVYLGVRLVLAAQRVYYERLGYRIVGEAAHPGYAAPTYAFMEKDLGRQS